MLTALLGTRRDRGHRRFGRFGVGAAVIAVAAGIVAVQTMTSGGRGAADAAAALDRERIRIDGLSIDFYSDWYHREYVRHGPESFGPMIHISSAPLAADDDDAAAASRAGLDSEDVLIVLMEYPFEEDPGSGFFVPHDEPLSLRALRRQHAFQGVPSSHWFANLAFHTKGRYFDLRVEFGDRWPSADLQALADDLLRSLAIMPQR